ncbi:hypothetical protein FEM11_32935 [Pseudomonas aeruginosa]|nr:hypothetical protein FEM11_32935 [Pseudomonas aeruginosa]
MQDCLPHIKVSLVQLLAAEADLDAANGLDHFVFQEAAVLTLNTSEESRAQEATGNPTGSLRPEWELQRGARLCVGRRYIGAGLALAFPGVLFLDLANSFGQARGTGLVAHVSGRLSFLDFCEIITLAEGAIDQLGDFAFTSERHSLSCFAKLSYVIVSQLYW